MPTKRVCSSKSHLAAKGVRQKEFGRKVAKKVTEASEKVTKTKEGKSAINLSKFGNFGQNWPRAIYLC